MSYKNTSQPMGEWLVGKERGEREARKRLNVLALMGRGERGGKSPEVDTHLEVTINRRTGKARMQEEHDRR